MGGLGQGGHKKIGKKHSVNVGHEYGDPEYNKWRIKIYYGTRLIFRSKRYSIEEATRKYKKIKTVADIKRILKEEYNLRVGG